MRSIRSSIAAALALAALIPTAAPAASRAGHAESRHDQAPAGPPRLIVAISVDQFSADLFAQYRQHFTRGIARLMAGAVFPSAYQSHAATETCPGHATLLTGVHPGRAGIVANWWYAPGLARADKRVYCAEDERDPQSTSRTPVVSAAHLKVPTLGDRLKAANPASLNIAVSGKDRAAVMMGGHRMDAGYWWKDEGFVTFRGQSPSAEAAAASSTAAETIRRGAPAYALPPWCQPRDREIAVGEAGQGTGRFALAKGDASAFRRSPRIDAATVDLAARLVDAYRLGADDAPDVLSVSLSATDYIGHAHGSEGTEMCIQMAELDRAIGRLLDHLDGLGIDYVVALSADHGGIDMPERLRQQAYPRAARADPALMPAALGAEISARTGIAVPSGPLLYGDGPFGDFWFSASLTSAQKARAVSALVALVEDHPQVAAVFTAQQLAEMPPPDGAPQDWTLAQRARASFDAQRSGDVVILLDRAILPIPAPAPGLVSTHGSPWDYDRRVPMLFWRKGLGGFEQPAPVETVDIAPTLAALLGLGVPDGAFDGRCRDIDGGPDNTCDGAR